MSTVPALAEAAEGGVPFQGHTTWYRVVERQEDAARPPLLCLHGGPGIPHDYLLPLEGIATTGRQVIFYDQLGCGRSSRPTGFPWSVQVFVEEIDAIRAALGLERVHLYGHSWGGLLALSYALTRPAGLASLTLASSAASIQQLLDHQLALVEEIEPGARERLLALTGAERTDDPYYQRIVEELFERRMTRIHPWPEYLTRAFQDMGGEVYASMWGTAGQFSATGTLRDFDVSDRLSEIAAPTLAIHGEDDYVVPELGQTLAAGLADARLVVVDDAGHLPFIDQTDLYLETISAFLDEVDHRNSDDASLRVS